MGLYLLTGTPGQSKGEAAKKIADWLRGRGLKVGLADVEEELLGSFPRYQDMPTSNKDPLVNLIGECAQLEIKDRWPKAYKAAVAKAQQGNPDVAIVVACLEYYRYETFEFYSPVDYGSVRESEPRSTLTLIDDIYEVYYRLSQGGQVFDIKELQERTFPVSGSENRDLRDLRRLYKDALNLAVGSLLRVLVWREKEIECAANLCRSVGSEHAMLAVKHPIETGARLLLGSTSSEFDTIGITYPIYVSHPISRPRRDRLSAGAWPPFVDHLDDVVACMAKEPVGNCWIAPVMPTAIDEFRILDDGTYLHPQLTPRWRISQGELLYTQPSAPAGNRAFADYEDYERRGLLSVFDPPLDSTGRRVGLPLSDSEVSGVLRTLKEAVRLQMAGRDHLLVRQCPGFFLYRALYGEFEFSGGVASEIHTFYQIRDYMPSVLGDRKRKVVFIHDNQDAMGLFKAIRSEETQKDEYPDPVRQASSAVHMRGRELVEASGTKTRRPLMPDDAVVAAALQVGGDPEEAAKAIHDHMFPVAKEGSIGGEQPLPWEATREAIRGIIQQEKVKALSSDISSHVHYTFSGDAVEHTFDASGESADAYIDVVAGLDATSERRLKAAARARGFFGGPLPPAAGDGPAK